MTKPMVIMLGTDLNATGGMVTVARNLRDGGLFQLFGIHYLVTYQSKSPLRQFIVVGRALLEFLWFIARHRVVLVHAHSASRGSFWRKSLFCAVADIFRIPYIFHIHSGEFPDFFREKCGPLAQQWVRRTLRRAATVVCLTKTWRLFVNDIEPLAKVTVIANPVVIPSYQTPLRDPPRNILFLGRLTRKKGAFDLVSAMPYALSICPQLRFVLGGDGDSEQIMALAKQLGVVHALELPGWIDGERKEAYLAQADIFVLPTHFEALGMANLEAMALGIPVLSTSVGGIPDVIENGVHGILVSPGNVETLASALIALANDRALRERLGQAASERASVHFSTPSVIACWEALYQSLGINQQLPEPNQPN